MRVIIWLALIGSVVFLGVREGSEITETKSNDLQHPNGSELGLRRIAKQKCSNKMGCVRYFNEVGKTCKKIWCRMNKCSCKKYATKNEDTKAFNISKYISNGGERICSVTASCLCSEGELLKPDLIGYVHYRELKDGVPYNVNDKYKTLKEMENTETATWKDVFTYYQDVSKIQEIYINFIDYNPVLTNQNLGRTNWFEISSSRSQRILPGEDDRVECNKFAASSCYPDKVAEVQVDCRPTSDDEAKIVCGVEVFCLCGIYGFNFPIRGEINSLRLTPMGESRQNIANLNVKMTSNASPKWPNAFTIKYNPAEQLEIRAEFFGKSALSDAKLGVTKYLGIADAFEHGRINLTKGSNGVMEPCAKPKNQNKAKYYAGDECLGKTGWMQYTCK